MRNVLRLASPLQAVQHIDRTAGRPAEAAVDIKFFPDNSIPRGVLTISWRTECAVMEVRLDAGIGGVGLVETLSAPDAACPA